jgi:hypothetical protein
VVDSPEPGANVSEVAPRTHDFNHDAGLILDEPASR